jgi:UDP-N-acetylmuramoyl-L-alanyl-D-glutamate--2,6-diaminopimelate ligase
MMRWLKNLGHFFIALGAALFYQFPARKLTVIGVTGTDGKTTTATLIYHLLKTNQKKVALISSVCAKIGQQQIDTGFHVTTPNPWPLQKLIKTIADQGYQYLVVEVTSHGLDQHRLFGIPFKIGVLTNITHEHLDYHPSYDHYLQTKTKLFRRAELAVLNQDDQSFTRVKSLLGTNVKVYPYSLKKANQRLLNCLKKRFPEPYNWQNGLAASTVAQILAIKPKRVYSALRSFVAVKGRMETIPNKKDIKVIVDFAHTPNALEQALKALRVSTKARIIAVFGCAGLRDPTKRPLMGEIASQLADVVVLTAEDPRIEDVNDIIAQIKQGATGQAQVLIEPDRQTAINLAITKLARKGDLVAIFGKGHERSMCFGRIEYPWSDQKAAQKALSLRN